MAGSKSELVVLGVHIGHDGGARLLRDGEIVAAMSEERLTAGKER